MSCMISNPAQFSVPFLPHHALVFLKIECKTRSSPLFPFPISTFLLLVRLAEKGSKVKGRGPQGLQINQGVLAVLGACPNLVDLEGGVLY